MTNAVNLSALGSNGGTSVSTWTTATRPASPLTGQTGFNTTLGSLESYNGSAWVSGGGLNTQAVQTTGFTAVAGNIYPCNTTSAAFTVTLPASPIAGNQVQIIDYAGTFATNNITLGRNGSNITGVAENYLLRANRQSTILTYIDATQGWVVSSAAYTLTPLVSTTYTATYLIIAGGGSGAGSTGGGGGAGGYLTGTSTLTVGTNYSFVVGAGGAQVAQQTIGNNGNNSTGFSLTAIGGGRGAGTTASSSLAGSSGGSGGGGAGYGGNIPNSGAGYAGTSGQGFAGGNRSDDSAMGGGGGAGAVGSNGSSGTGGAGGAGLASSITGTSVTRAGGGGGGGGSGGGAGGAGGGGIGQLGDLANGTAGTVNTGSGGGGGYNYSGGIGRAGGSGIVIISVPTPNYSGTTTGSPTITTSGSNTILQFTSSGTYTG